MYSIYSKEYRDYEKVVIRERNIISKKYNKLKIPINGADIYTIFCPNCGYETYENNNYCIVCGSKLEKDDEWFANLISEIQYGADYENNKILKSISKEEIIDLKYDWYFKNKCNNFLLANFYILANKLYTNDETKIMIEKLKRMDEIYKLIILNHLYKCVYIRTGLIKGELKNWKGFGFLLNYDSNIDNEFEFVSNISIEYISYVHVMSKVYKRHPNYKSIEEYWEDHSSGELSLKGYALGTIELLDGAKKAYLMDSGKSKITDFKDRKDEYIDGNLCLKLEAIKEMLRISTNGDYYKTLWFEFVKRCQLHPKDEMHILWKAEQNKPL